jgi:isoleucyl-tRNA synthetase
VDIVIQSADVSQRLQRYEPLLREELNVHEVRWLLPGQEGEAVAYQLKPNFRALGPRLGKRVQTVKKILGEADAGKLRSELASTGRLTITLDGEALELTPEEVQVVVVASEGFAAAGGSAGVVVLHTALDEALLDEGLAREVLAKVQAERKRLNLGYTERIVLTVRGSERICRVVDAARAHISGEALCVRIEIEALSADALADDEQNIELGDERLQIDVKGV